MISFTKSNDIVCTLNFYDIIKKCMISYMILNMISIFHIVRSFVLILTRNNGSELKTVQGVGWGGIISE